MAKRKPLPEGCDGGIWCEVPGHVTTRAIGTKGRFVIGHIPLTRGQHLTLMEREEAASEARKQERLAQQMSTTLRTFGGQG